ncbi:MAG: hypothetical protein PVF18_04810 [Anaerolineales bacterium]
MTLAPILFLLLSALITWLIRRRHNRTQWIVAGVLGFTVWALMLVIDPDQASVVSLSIWQPEDLFQSPISLSLDPITWPLVYGTTTVLLAVILTADTRPTGAHAGMRSFWFLYTASAVAAIMAANLLTTAIGWTVMDLGTLFFFLTISEGPSDRRAIFIRAGVNAVSVLLVVAAAMASEIQAISALDLTAASASGIMLLALAATFRLGLIPLHFALPTIAPLRRGVGTFLRLFPPVVAMALLARVFAAGLPEIMRIIFFFAGGLAGLLAALRWVFQEETVGARPFFVLALSSLGLIAATISAQGYPIIVAVGVMLLLVGAVVSLFEQHTPSHRAIPVVTSILLLGIPFTPGGMYAAVIGDLDNFLGAPLMGIIALIISSLLALGCFHLYFFDETDWPISESIGRVMFNLGLVLPLLAAIGVGVWRLRSEPVNALIGSTAALLLTAGFFFGFRSLTRERIAIVRGSFQWFDPERAYETIWKLWQRVLVLVRQVADLLEGVSGMLWLFVFVIIILFIIQ